MQLGKPKDTDREGAGGRQWGTSVSTVKISFKKVMLV